MNEIFDVRDKVVLVTGASRGIGFMIAGGFLDAGARVYVSSRKPEACESAVMELGKRGPCEGIAADLGTAAGIEHLAAEMERREPMIHVLVNNAGATWGEPLETYPEEAFDRLWALNVKAVFGLTRRLLHRLRAAATSDDPARVITIGSLAGHAVPFHIAPDAPPVPVENYAYSASKAGVHMLTRHLAHRLAAEHITVNAIAPGPFESRMTAFALGTDEGRSRAGQGVPLGRIGRPDDVAGTAIFLASRAGSYLTGAVIPLDGGLSTHS